ncbi:MAG: hypothetical protein HKN23_13105, partial [Verrucomicrobiales bacterium]|nr:hypothetical protein [Verrucomicrobiales bacterium]
MKFALSALLLLLFSPISEAIDAGRSLYIEGYPARISYAPGDELELHISTTSPKYSLQIQRHGAETKTVFEKTDIEGGLEYAIPEHASAKGCGWPVGFKLKIPEDWQTGYYTVTMRIKDRGGKYTQWNTRTAESSLYFVLRPKVPGANSKILLQLATNTYNAYNNWGGGSLYGFHGRANLQGHEVSFHRPQRSLFSRWELDFVKWAESNGYALDFCANQDLQFMPKIVEPYRLILSVGHDEYWSAEMRDTAEQFIADGGNMAFFSGNTCCWQVRWQEKTQSLLCWKQWFNQDPFYAGTPEDKRRMATLWSHHLIGRPENELTGVGFLHGGYHRSHGHFMDGTGAFKVHRPDHWILEGTDLKRGDEFGGKDTIVGYECDGCEIEWREGLPFPTHKDGTPKTFEILATCPAQWAAGDAFWYEKWPGKDHQGNAVLGMWASEKSGTVVTTGTTDWAHGLKGKDPAVVRITKNVL